MSGAVGQNGAAAHILIVLHDFHAGGTENIAFRLADEWCKAGRRVSILAGADDGPMRARIPDCVAVHILSPQVRRGFRSRQRLGAALQKDARALAPDLVFIPGNYHFMLTRALRRVLPASVIVAKVSNPLLPNTPRWLRPFGRWKLGRKTRAIDCVVYMADALKTRDEALLPPMKHMTIAEPNLAHGHCPAPRSVAEAPPLVLMIARMEPQKDLTLGIRAFAKLRERHDARLLILGEGRERPLLERMIDQLGLGGCVEMPGFVSDVAPFLARASMLLLSSRFEGYPSVVVEALAADVPIATTRCTPVLASLIASPVHGYVASAPTPDALADAMAAVLTQPFTSGGVRPATVACHCANASASAYLTLFDTLVSEKAGRDRPCPVMGRAMARNLPLLLLRLTRP